METEYGQKLINNPILYLSSGSKELFHSNFLYWLSFQYRELFIAIFDQFGYKASSWDEDFTVEREYRHFDLCIRKGKDILLVLENKMKSIPDARQLEEYNQKLDNTPGISGQVQKVLLSMQDFKDCWKYGWSYVTYKEYSDTLKYKVWELGIKDTYVNDYVRFVSDLSNFAELWQKQVGYRTRFNQLTTKENPFYKDCHELRIHDMYSKLVYSEIRKMLVDELKGMLDEIEVEEANFFRGTPILTVSYNNSRFGPKRIVVQIQDGRYKYIDIWDRDSEAFKLEEHSGRVIAAELLGGEALHPVKDKTYNVYRIDEKDRTEEHRYRYKIVDDECTIGTLLDKICSDMKILCNK